MAALEVGERDRPPGPRRLVQRADDAHVRQSLTARRLGLLVLEHAPREVDQLGCELVLLRIPLLRRPAVDRELMAERLRHLVRRVDAEHALRAPDLVPARVRGAEAARERREALDREAEDRAGHLGRLLEALVAADRRGPGE